MTISPDQFADQLMQMEERTGIEYGPGHITLPGGIRLPAMHRLATWGDPRSRNPGTLREVLSQVPSETGAVHSIINSAPSGLHDPRMGDWDLRHHAVVSMSMENDQSPSWDHDRDVNRYYHDSVRSGRTSHASPEAWSEGVMRSLTEFVPENEDRERDQATIRSTAKTTQSGLYLPVIVGGDMPENTSMLFDLSTRMR